MLAACSAEFSDQRGHEHADLDGLQSTHSHSKGYISFPYSWRTQRLKVTWKVNGSSGIFSFSKNVLVFFYCQHFIMKIFKDRVKLKEFYSEPRFLESIISILLCLLYHIDDFLKDLTVCFQESLNIPQRELISTYLTWKNTVIIPTLNNTIEK